MEIAARVVSSVVGRASTSQDSQNGAKPVVGKVVDVSDAAFIGGFIPSIIDKQQYPYSRPDFLFFTDDDISLSCDHTIRPIITPKHPEKMPLFAGYAEVINAGKSKLNEDQGSARMLYLLQQGRDAEAAIELDRQRQRRGGRETQTEDDPLLTPGTDESDSSQICISRVEAALFSLYDGHAGPSAAVLASKCYHEHLKSRLAKVIDAIISLDKQESQTYTKRSESSYSFTSKLENMARIRSEQLVCGALETSFVDMDEQIGDDKQVWRLPGGCAAISVLVLLGKLYVANAGDCRAILVTSEGARPLSKDMTPASERKRLQELAYQCPELVGSSFSRLEYSRRLTRRDLNTTVLFRDWFMDGWSAKTVKESDLKPPLISETSKKKRLLNTIGVSRGFGDHHLLTVDDRLSIKPFLSPVPEISIIDLRDLDILSDKDIVIMASDGLWDVISNEDAGLIVRSILGSSEPSDPLRYTLAAQELVQAARGFPAERSNRWIMSGGGHASCDDITVFIIPLKYCAAPPTNFEEDDDDEEMINLE